MIEGAGGVRVRVSEGRLQWFTDLRWWAIGAGFVVVLTAQSFWPVRYDVPRLMVGLLVLAGLNVFYQRVWRKTLAAETDASLLERKSRWHIRVQMLGDLALLTLLLAGSGGVENPFFLLYLFHLAIGSMALPWKESAVYAALATLLPWLLWGLHRTGAIQPLWLDGVSWGGASLPALLSVYSATAWGLWFFLTSLTGDLLKKEKALQEAGERLRTANEDLRQLDDQKNRFFRQIAHELKNPLAAVGSCLDAADATWPKGKALRSHGMVERARSRLGAVAELMDDLIWLSQSKSADPPYRREETNPYSLVRRSVQDLQEKLGSRCPEITVEGRPALRGTFWVDPRAFRRVVDNLLENAVKYTPVGRGPLTVRLEDQGRWLAVAFEDPGIGIPEMEKAGLFQEFMRASNARSSGQPGTGLGLTIVKRILDWHGGTVVIQSSQGKGTRVETRWPLTLKD
jgi:signal transduction histidine kinase